MTQGEWRTVLNQELAVFFGNISRHFDARFDAIEQKLETKTGRIYSQLDGIAARLEEDNLQRVALGHQVNRHERQIRRLIIKTKTSVPRADKTG